MSGKPTYKTYHGSRLTGHVRTKTHFSGFRIYQDLAANSLQRGIHNLVSLPFASAVIVTTCSTLAHLPMGISTR
jgi:hypothetical protein